MGLPLQTLLEARRKHLNGMHFSETAVLPLDAQLREHFFQVQAGDLVTSHRAVLCFEGVTGQ